MTAMAAAQDSGTGISGYTYIDYDEETNVVTAYAETYGNYDVMGEYNAEIWLTVTKQTGETVASGGRVEIGGNPATVLLQFQGEPNTTYTAIGVHRARLYLWDYAETFPPQRFYYDNYYFTPFGSQSIYQPWDYFFQSPGYRIFQRSNDIISLGRTYDSISTVPSLNRGRLQAQGSNPPVEKSRAWSQTSVPTKSEGIAMINSLWDSLSRSERGERGQAYIDAYRYIERSPPEGRPFNGRGGKSFVDPQRTDPSARIDVEIIIGFAFRDDNYQPQ